MPKRVVPLVNGEVYHVYNRGVDGRVTFEEDREYARMALVLWYYQFLGQRMRLAFYLQLKGLYQIQAQEQLVQNSRRVVLLAYCLMSNHYHLVLRQVDNGGISRYMADVQNSYIRYFNTKQKRKGNLFTTQFKAVHVDSDDELQHLIRYVHLNPLTSRVVDSLELLKQYSWSSLPVYLGLEDNSRHMLDTTEVRYRFETSDDYWKYVTDQADYQRELQLLKKFEEEIQ